MGWNTEITGQHAVVHHRYLGDAYQVLSIGNVCMGAIFGGTACVL